MEQIAEKRFKGLEDIGYGCNKISKSGGSACLGDGARGKSNIRAILLGL